jgi:hypothetical protein
VELVHLVGFIAKKFVTLHGHMNVKKKKKPRVHIWHVCGHAAASGATTRANPLAPAGERNVGTAKHFK